MCPSPRGRRARAAILGSEFISFRRVSIHKFTALLIAPVAISCRSSQHHSHPVRVSSTQTSVGCRHRGLRVESARDREPTAQRERWADEHRLLLSSCFRSTLAKRRPRRSMAAQREPRVKGGTTGSGVSPGQDVSPSVPVPINQPPLSHARALPRRLVITCRRTTTAAPPATCGFACDSTTFCSQPLPRSQPSHR